MKLSRGAQRLYDLLSWYGSRFRRIHPTQQRLADHLKVEVRQVQRYVRELSEAALLTVRKCGRNAADYNLYPQPIADKNVGSKSGRSRVEVGSVPYITSLENVSQSKAQHRAWCEQNLPGPGTPEFHRVMEQLRAAQERIRRADNPLAYERGVIMRALGIERKPPQSEGIRGRGRREA